MFKLNNDFNISKKEIIDLLNISGTQIANLEKGKTKKVKTKETKRKQMKLLKIDYLYIDEIKDKLYTKTEVKNMCKEYNVTLKIFCTYLNDNPAEYNKNKLILNKNGGIYVGNKIRMSNEFLQENYEAIDKKIEKTAYYLNLNQSMKEDLKSQAYEVLIKEGGIIEKNFRFDNNLVTHECQKLAKRVMIKEKYNVPKEKSLIIKKEGNKEFSYLDIIGDEEYNPYKMIDNSENYKMADNIASTKGKLIQLIECKKDDILLKREEEYSKIATYMEISMEELKEEMKSIQEILFENGNVILDTHGYIRPMYTKRIY